MSNNRQNMILVKCIGLVAEASCSMVVLDKLITCTKDDKFDSASLLFLQNITVSLPTCLQ